MPNYKDMYLEMVDATEKAINILVAAQRNAEEMYISSSDPDLRIVPDGEDANQTEE